MERSEGRRGQGGGASAQHAAYLVLGSNIEPERHLPEAVRLLSCFGRIGGHSRAWQSAPVGDPDQADFVNGAVLLETPWTAERLLAECIPRIERRLRRVRDPANKNGPRTIDIDLAFFDTDARFVFGKPIPDPQTLTRSFVAIPLAELDPEYRHPATGECLSAVARRLAREFPLLVLRDDIRLDAHLESARLRSGGSP